MHCLSANLMVSFHSGRVQWKRTESVAQNKCLCVTKERADLTLCYCVAHKQSPIVSRFFTKSPILHKWLPQTLWDTYLLSNGNYICGQQWDDICYDGCSALGGRHATAGLSVLAARLKHTLPDLPYDYNALEPVISAEIMQLHHQKHHQAYVNNLNIAEEKLHEAINKSRSFPPTNRAVLALTKLLLQMTRRPS